MITAAEILTATDEKILELGTEGAVRILGGKTEENQVSLGKKLLLLKKAYYNPEMTVDERESILYCLIKLSEKFITPANTNSGGLSLDLNVVKPDNPLEGLFFFGRGSDVVNYFGRGTDVTEFI